MKRPKLAAPAVLIAAILLPRTALAEDPQPAPLNYKIELRCKLGDAPEQVLRLSDAEGIFEAEHPNPQIIFKATVERREGKAYVLKYDCAWQQNIVEAPRDPERPKVPKGAGSVEEGAVRGKARIAVGRPVDVFDGADSKVTIVLLEAAEVPDADLNKVEIRPAIKVTDSE